MGWIDSQLANINWRLCLIFLPAILNGQWANLGFYSPFIFSYVLSSCRAELFRLTSEGFFSNKGKTLYVLAQIVGFTLFVQYFESEGKYLSSFFFSSFLCPAIRHYSPSHGDQIVYGIVTLALTGAYIFQGLGPFFFGLFFLQGVPEIQRHLWFEPTKNFCLIGSVFLLTAPFTSLGTVAYWKQDWLPLFPVTYLKVLTPQAERFSVLLSVAMSDLKCCCCGLSFNPWSFI